MKVFETILMILGAAFVGVGALVSIVFIAAFDGIGFFVAIPLFFCLLGFCFIGGVLFARVTKKRIIKNGTKYAAKIYGYVRNTSVEVNGQFTFDTKVHYFDRNGIEREAVLGTGFAEGAGSFPIGMTIDIYEWKGKYNFDPDSVRDEVLDREAELMDDKPVDPSKLKAVAITCKNCGASYEAAKGYSSKCPYCGGYINA